jgi:3-deoxy-7-phosphoheptulonate synthase
MIIELENNIAPGQKTAIQKELHQCSFKVVEVTTQMNHYLIAIGNEAFDIRSVGSLPGVTDIHIVSDKYKLVSKKWKINPTLIDLGDGVQLGENSFQAMAGPCSIEGPEQIEKTIAHLKQNGVSIMRGGVFKPRSSPYSFRGLGLEGLKMWHQAAKAAGIKIVTEVMQVSQIKEMEPYVDIFQVGARNTQNFNLLDELGKNTDKAVLIKRGISGSIDELLHSAEYVFSAGNERLVLCERGIRTYETATRNTLDINAIAVLKEKTHLPVIADPSHGTGIRTLVEPIALACIMAGADGILYETHKTPDKAFSDGQQTLDFNESAQLLKWMRQTYLLRRKRYSTNL